MKPITLEMEIAELQRELETRETVYPKWIAQNKIKADLAAHRTECTRRTLKRLQDIKLQIDAAVQPELFAQQ
jgi:phosphoenolpyruvate carboxylase